MRANLSPAQIAYSMLGRLSDNSGVTIEEILGTALRDCDPMIKPSKEQLKKQMDNAVKVGFLIYDPQTERYIFTEPRGLDLFPSSSHILSVQNSTTKVKFAKAMYLTRVEAGTTRPR
jgi:hypothetical protein